MKIRLGDIVEFHTKIGFAYAIYTHQRIKSPRYGSLIRVFEGVFEHSADDLTLVLARPLQFSTFFPLQAAVNQKVVVLVGNKPIPKQLLAFPVFRNGLADPITKKVNVWWLWDGEKTWKVGELTPEQRRFPIEGVCNLDYITTRIEEGWRPEYDTR